MAVERAVSWLDTNDLSQIQFFSVNYAMSFFNIDLNK